MKLVPLFGEVKTRRVVRSSSTKRAPKAKSDGYGCAACPLDKVEGLNKLINLERIKGRKVFIWAQSPGKKENARKLELVGNAGEFLWEELRAVGIERSDCDIQNVCRCQPIIVEDENTPTKAMLKACSVYNPQAIERNRKQAVVHLILGKIAGQQLLGKLYSKAKAAVWHPEWNAYVVVADHPARILRSRQHSKWLYFAFKDKMRAVKAILDHPGRWGYVKAQNYGAVTTPQEMATLKAEIFAEATEGRRVSVDIEDGIVNGKRVILMIGFGMGVSTKYGAWTGKARSVVLHHPEASQLASRLNPLLRDLKEILEDPTIKKILQHGSYDVERLNELLGIQIRGYDFDTQYGSYLHHSHLRTYSLESLVGYFHMEFADYKDMVDEWKENFALAPLKQLVTYNCADCDLTKRIESKTAGKISHALLQVYIHAAFIIDKMQNRGPILDEVARQAPLKIILPRVKELTGRLKALAQREDFNPNTPAHIATLLYKTLNIPMTAAGRATGKDVLDELAMDSDHPGIRLVQNYRKVSRMEIILNGYKKSADEHEGELRTVWWLTGAATGRLRSGKSEKAEKEEGVINFQNLIKNAVLKNPLVSDKNWRLALK